MKAQITTYQQQTLYIGRNAEAIVINGHQLRDALSLIAPDGTPEQLAHTLCIQAGPARRTSQGTEPAGLFCWLQEYPEEGSVRLDEHPRESAARLSTDPRVLAIAERLVEAARWIYANAEARRQPDARALAKVVLRLAAPIINAHADAAATACPTNTQQS